MVKLTFAPNSFTTLARSHGVNPIVHCHHHHMAGGDDKSTFCGSPDRPGGGGAGGAAAAAFGFCSPNADALIVS